MSVIDFSDHLSDELRWREEFSQNPLSLVDASALRIASNLNLTLSAVKVVPHSLYPVLLAASLDTKLVVSTKAIVAAWPRASLSFKTLQKLTRLPRRRAFYDTQDEGALAVAMAVSEDKESKIQDIDITSLNLSWKAEVQFLEMLLNGRVLDEAEPKRKRKRRQASGLEGEKGYKMLRVTTNATIKDSRTADYLKLQSRLRDVNIHVCYRTLTASQCGLELLNKILDSVEKEGMIELDIGHNSLQNSGLERALHPVKAFCDLTILGVCYNLINVRNEHADRAISALGSALSTLPHLRSLKLNGNRLTGRLAEVLGPMKQSLFVLDVVYCTLAPEDFLYLAGSHHAAHLKHLFLRDNHAIGLHPHATEQLLPKLSASLVELDLERTRLGAMPDRTLDILTGLAPRFVQLKCLKIHNNQLDCQDQVDVVLAFVACPSMKELCVSFPTKIMQIPWMYFRGQKLTKRLSPHRETTAVKWFTLSCWKRLPEATAQQRVGRSPLMVHTYVEDGTLDVTNLEFPIPIPSNPLAGFEGLHWI